MQILGELFVTDNTKLVLSKGEFKGQERIDLRTEFNKDGEFIKTRKGINFNAEWVDDFIKLVEKLKD
ncbi:transcriptional coactivator p15/PC4 family protein [Candidatus Woesearchaeota archaeon]|jgi:hypothetical protein|nr:transcriptional coactivator p15/PC4 family protein [Candidatus Woesearchaeota archaeon]